MATEKIDDMIQSISTYDPKASAEENLNARLSNLPANKYEQYKARYEELKREHPTMANAYATVEGGNVISQLWNAATGKIDEEQGLKNYIYEQEKTFMDRIAGAGEKGPNVGTMLANVPGSALKVASGTLRAATNPLDTLV